jgi:two-component system chemotaxis response regulator CheB
MKKIRVVVVDDSAYSRRTITRMLESFDGIEVAGFACNGEEGIQKVISLKPDLVTLDLEMPRMDGFTLLRILKTRFSLPVIVISASSAADKVFKALELGAFDFIAKPGSSASTELLTIRDDLGSRVFQAALSKTSPASSCRPVAAHGGPGRQLSAAAVARPAPGLEMVAIGTSTGGPPALQKIFSDFERQFPFAVVVAQHMPAGFTRAFAERLNRSSPFEIREAADGDAVLPGLVLIAPGGKNMVVEADGGKVIARILEPTSADRYLPSVDLLFQSCARLYRDRLAAVILTGMGNDGSCALGTVKEQGGFVIAESDESAVVYGMPREALATGLVDRVAPLQRIAQEILIRGDFL